MTTYQQIRFSVKKDVIDSVKNLIKNYAEYVGKYANDHDEEWSWSTFQSRDQPADFVSIIAHENADAETRHMEEEGTREFPENLYAYVTDNKQIAYRLIASSDTSRSEFDSQQFARDKTARESGLPTILSNPAGDLCTLHSPPSK